MGGISKVSMNGFFHTKKKQSNCPFMYIPYVIRHLCIGFAFYYGNLCTSRQHIILPTVQEGQWQARWLCWKRVWPRRPNAPQRRARRSAMNPARGHNASSVRASADAWKPAAGVFSFFLAARFFLFFYFLKAYHARASGLYKEKKAAAGQLQAIAWRPNSRRNLSARARSPLRTTRV